MSPVANRVADDADVRCACCERLVKGRDSLECPVCRRRACFECLRPYGHHMQVCEDCRIERW
jgi:hypothetical protein